MSPGVLFDYESRVISLHGHVCESDFTVLTDHLLRLDTESPKTITIYLTAQGGNLIDALKILDVFETLRSPTVGIALGLNEGAAVLILAAAKTRIMLPSAILHSIKLWNLPNENTKIGLHSVTTISLRSLLHRRLKVIASRWTAAVQLAHEAEKEPRLISAGDALELGLIDQIHSLTVDPVKARRSHVR